MPRPTLRAPEQHGVHLRMQAIPPAASPAVVSKGLLTFARPVAVLDTIPGVYRWGTELLLAEQTDEHSPLSALSCLGEEKVVMLSGTLIACFFNNSARWLFSLIFALSLSSASAGQPQAELNDQASQLVLQGDRAMEGAYEPTHQGGGGQRPYEDLLAKAKAQGSVRVIVRLKFNDWKPEGDLPNQQAAAVQREAIAHLQARLLNRMASFEVSDVKQFRFVPQIAMKVNARGLQDLLSNPEVTGIWEDVPLAPGR